MNRASRETVLQQAEIWIAYDKPAMATGMLRSALQADASREDIRSRLRELEFIFSDHAIAGSTLLKHRLVA